MPRRRSVVRWAFVVLTGASAGLAADGPVRSGLQPGESLPGVFHPLNVTGAHAGEQHCLVCEHGLSPVAMVFAREPSEPVLKLLARLDAAAAKHRDRELGCFAVFLGDADGLVEPLRQAQRKTALKFAVLSVDDPAGPEGFRVARDADVTVVLYLEHVVKANHAFRKGELTPAAIDKVLADLPKVLPPK